MAAVRRFVSGQHHFFDDLVALLSSLSSIGVSTEIYGGHGNGNWGPNDTYAIYGSPQVTNLGLLVKPVPLMQTLASNQWPSVIELTEVPWVASPGPSAGVLYSHKGTMTLLQEAIFVRYFETYQPSIRAKHGTKSSAWPNPWKFGRIVRNAFAHGRRIDIRPPTSPPVTWRGVTYGPSDNGRPIAVTEFTTVEVITLMEEMDPHI